MKRESAAQYRARLDREFAAQDRREIARLVREARETLRASRERTRGACSPAIRRATRAAARAAREAIRERARERRSEDAAERAALRVRLKTALESIAGECAAARAAAREAKVNLDARYTKAGELRRRQKLERELVREQVRSDRAKVRSTARERRYEDDEKTEGDMLAPESREIWRALSAKERAAFRAGEHASRAEVFEHWIYENPDEAATIRWEAINRELAREDAEEKKKRRAELRELSRARRADEDIPF